MKLKLNDIKVKSFVTSQSQAKTVGGRDPLNPLESIPLICGTLDYICPGSNPPQCGSEPLICASKPPICIQIS